MRNMNNLLIFIGFIIVMASAQLYPWQGDWKVWNIIPGTHIGRCCKPSSVKITVDTKDSNILHFFIDMPPQPECPSYPQPIVITESVSLGRFHDKNPNSTLINFRGSFYPNNNTIVITPGPLGTCKWVLGSPISINTNTSESNLAMAWEGPWVIDATYKGTPDAKCCLPLTPLIVKEDVDTFTISFNSYYPKQDECSIELNENTLAVNTTVSGGAFETHGITGYYLPNGTMLTERTGCIKWWSKWSANKSTVGPKKVELIELPSKNDDNDIDDEFILELIM
jgi:hypothetical protein